MMAKLINKKSNFFNLLGGEISGERLMSVMDAMFSEAEEGNVPAARLILEHYNKLNYPLFISEIFIFGKS